jgi:hypothetical protein
VSITSWAVAFASTSFWLSYAIVDHRPLVIVTALTSLSFSAAICTFELLTARHAAAGTAPDEAPAPAQA